MGFPGPVGFVIATGGCGSEAIFMTKPLMAKAIKLSRTNIQTLRRRERIEWAGIEGGENFLNVNDRGAMDKLSFFITGRIECSPRARKVFRIEFSLRRIQAWQQNGLDQRTEAVAESLN